MAAGAMMFLVVAVGLRDAYVVERGRKVALLTGLSLAGMLVVQQYL